MIVHLAFRFQNSRQDGNGDSASYLSLPCCSLFQNPNGDNELDAPPPSPFCSLFGKQNGDDVVMVHLIHYFQSKMAMAMVNQHHHDHHLVGEIVNKMLVVVNMTVHQHHHHHHHFVFKIVSVMVLVHQNCHQMKRGCRCLAIPIFLFITISILEIVMKQQGW